MFFFFRMKNGQRKLKFAKFVHFCVLQRRVYSPKPILTLLVFIFIYNVAVFLLQFCLELFLDLNSAVCMVFKKFKFSVIGQKLIEMHHCVLFETTNNDLEKTITACLNNFCFKTTNHCYNLLYCIIQLNSFHFHILNLWTIQIEVQISY